MAYIGDSAFYNCPALTEITIPSRVARIGKDAFRKCDKLKKLVFAANSELRAIGEGAFYECSGMDGVYLSDISFWFNIKFGNYGSAPFNRRAALYINERLVTDLVIPYGVTRIESDAFRFFTTLRSIMIPDTVTSIGNGAFYGCVGLTEVIIPDSVDRIETGAFYGCVNLIRISIPRTAEQGSNVFYGCAGVPTVR
jgi:hypothetical protein